MCLSHLHKARQVAALGPLHDQAVAPLRAGHAAKQAHNEGAVAAGHQVGHLLRLRWGFRVWGLGFRV